MIVLFRKHRGKRALFQFGFNRLDFRLEIGAQALIVQLGEFECIMHSARKSAPRLDLGLGVVILFHHLLSLRGIPPEIRCFYFFFKLR